MIEQYTVSCRRLHLFFLFKQKTAYEMRISDWSSDVCSSDLPDARSATPAPPSGPAASPQRARGRSRRIRARAHPPEGRRRSFVVHPAQIGLDRIERIGAAIERSEERRDGKEWVSTGRSRWSPSP